MTLLMGGRAASSIPLYGTHHPTGCAEQLNARESVPPAQWDVIVARNQPAVILPTISDCC
jgi:hypothetical protein